MLGLLGTVTGMIISFGQISRFGTGDPSIVANGIGQALVTTAAGLIVAIPVIMGHAFLSSRVEAILVDIDRRREELMGNIAQAVASRREESQPAERAPAAPRPTPAGHAREDARGREDAGAGRALTPDPA